VYKQNLKRKMLTESDYGQVN